MNLEDESLLSAYLDDELDPADRLAVEWSVESSPPLADQLRSLASAREIVANLGRPDLPVDLAPSIIARLSADRRRARLHTLARPGRVAMAVAGLSAMAASLLFALLQLHRSMHETPQTQIAVHVEPVVPADRSHLIPNPDRVPTPAIVSNDPVLKAPEASPPSPVKVASDIEARDRADRQRIGEMLERPDVRLVLITTDVIDASDQIRNLIRKDARDFSEFGRITIQTGIVVDPERPGSAEVFVVPINEGGRNSFVNQLRGRFKDLEEDATPSPELVTQLTEVGQVAIFEGTRASSLVDSPIPIPPHLAIKPVVEPGAGPSPTDEPSETLVAETEAEPSSLDPIIGPPSPSRRLEPSDPLTLLVWVTRPRRH
ncbi:anti-sigma factor family protein [Tundrisphaera lichenicola]|uniref:anti-sigma factor family protein n=1 Tax=Tundrisphaera lichenicola TaxID=2029860 RepID=UPI003EB7C80A